MDLNLTITYFSPLFNIYMVGLCFIYSIFFTYLLFKTHLLIRYNGKDKDLFIMVDTKYVCQELSIKSSCVSICLNLCCDTCALKNFWVSFVTSNNYIIIKEQAGFRAGKILYKPTVEPDTVYCI